MNEEQIDEKVLKGELAGVPMGEQQETEDPLSADINKEALEATEQAAAEEPEKKPEEQAGKETPAAEETPAEGQQDPKVDGAFANMRREVASLRAQIQVSKVAPQPQVSASAPPEKSPRHVYLAENPDAEYFPPSVEVAQDEWKAGQSAKVAETTRQATEFKTVTKSMEDAYVAITDETHGVALQTLHGLGAHLLTPNDNARIYMAGQEAGEQLHSILTKRVKDAGLYPQASSVPKPVPKGGGLKPSAPNQEQQIQSEAPELDEHNARICEDLHLRR